MNRTVVSMCAAAFAGCAFANTVALWPLEYDPLNPDNGGRCAVSSDNDLTVSNVTRHGSALEDGPGWNLPPNPDTTDGLRFAPLNRSVIGCSSSGQGSFLVSADFARRYLLPSKDFTFEGWIKLASLPGNGGFFMIANAFGSSDANRFLFTFRNNSGGYTSATDPDDKEWYSFQVWHGRPAVGECVLWKPKGDDLAGLTSGWHHFALSHTPRAEASGKAEWKFFWDGDCKTTVQTEPQADPVDANVGDPSFWIGARDRGNMMDAWIDCCRVSDKVLDASELLCAGGQGTVVEPPASDPTVAYWPLGKSAEGTVDGTPAVGEAYLGGCFLDSPNGGVAANRLLVADDDCAFKGAAPNAASTLKAPADSTGCLCVPGNIENLAFLDVKNLGNDLTLLNDFTVEGWYKFELRDPKRPLDGWAHLCGARATSGWTWQLKVNSDGTNYLSLHVSYDGTNIHGANPPDFGPVTPGVWTHIALVYDADGGGDGKGLWTCYRDGALAGTLVNTVAIPSDAAVNVPNLRFSDTAMCATGCLDHWRVCKAALEPDQFLCAASGRDASNVLAYWPFDAQNGVCIDGTDLTGNYTIENPRSADRLCKAVDDTPPQADLPADAGSVGFANDGGYSSYLYTTDPSVNAVFAKDAWTFETWMKRTVEDSSWQLLMFAATLNVTLTASPGSFCNFSYRPQNGQGFVMHSSAVAPGVADTPFKGADGQTIQIPLNEWVHVGLTMQIVKQIATWTLYTNGVRAAALTGTGPGIRNTVCGVLVGGRPNSGNSFRGRLAGVRFSDGLLDPTQFLCSRKPEKKQLAFWPINCKGGQLDLSGSDGVNAVLSGVGATGSPLRSRGRFTLLPGVSNAGSAALSATGCLASALPDPSTHYLGGAWTVEGWVKWNGATGANQTIVGNWNGTDLGGWRLSLDAGSSPAKFRLVFKARRPGTVVADGEFAADASALADGWHHLALSYDPAAYRGVWSLAIDGVAVGTVPNAYAPAADSWGDDGLRLGADANGDAAFNGLVDMWRISSGVLTVEETLWQEALGLLMLFR